MFMVGSLLAGLSQEMWQLVAARGIQGLGAGALFPIALAVIGDLFAPSERGRYQGLFGAVFGLSVLIGPAIGGLITDTIGWPFVFFVNLPIGAIVFAVVSAQPARVPPRRRQADDRLPRRRACSPRALVPILVGLTNKQSADWTDPTVGGLIAARRGDRARAFVFVESRAREPIVPLALFRIRSFTVSVVAVFLAVVRVLRDRGVPAALVPGRERLVGDRVRLPDPAAARRADHQRGRVRARSWPGPADTGC